MHPFFQTLYRRSVPTFKTNVRTVTFVSTAMNWRELFCNPGKGRNTNDSLNKTRETFLASLLDSPQPEYEDIRNQWNAFLHSLCQDEHDRVTVKKIGGRSANYDFEISFYKDGTCLKTIKTDYKHNASTLQSLPEFFSPAADKPYLSVSYAQWYYHQYLDRVCSIYGLSKPDEVTYLQCVYNNDYDKHPFFRAFYVAEAQGTREQYKQKQQLVKQSINEYLQSFINSLDLRAIEQDIRNRQVNKVFILWNLKEFRADTIRDDELDIVGVEGIKNGNTIVLSTKAGTKYNMLLRWKNHIGILYPAWQISLSR
jgi:hypothetical protein